MSAFDIDAFLRGAGFDPDQVGAHFREVAMRAVYQAGFDAGLASELARREAAQAALDRSRTNEDCGCSVCEKAKDDAFSAGLVCEQCGYAGRFAAVPCACYDSSCPGGATRGAGCFHGALICPACDDGDALAPLIRDVRVALRARAEKE